MPTYDYECSSCRTALTLRHAMDEAAPACPDCNGRLERRFNSAPAFHGDMARGREAAVRSLAPKDTSGSHRCGPGCRHSH